MSFDLMLVDNLIGDAIMVFHSRVCTRWESINWNKLKFCSLKAKNTLFIFEEKLQSVKLLNLCFLGYFLNSDITYIEYVALNIKT